MTRYVALLKRRQREGKNLIPMPALKPAAPIPSARLNRPRRFSNATIWYAPSMVTLSGFQPSGL